MRLLALALLSLVAVAHAAPEAAVSFRTAKYIISIKPTEDSASEAATLDWSYPVVLRHPGGAVGRINDWIRTQALEDLARCADVPLDTLRRLSDRQVVEKLSQPGACHELRQSALTLTYAFGDYLAFTRSVSSMGSARLYPATEVRLLDIRRQQTLSTGDLFRPGALEALNGLLAEQIEADNRPDCPGRSFQWSQASFRPPRLLGIDFPYDSAEWRACGDGVESLDRPEVARLLKPALRLRPEYAAGEAP